MRLFWNYLKKTAEKYTFSHYCVPEYTVACRYSLTNKRKTKIRMTHMIFTKNFKKIKSKNLINMQD
jgi:hypothetical protein